MDIIEAIVGADRTKFNTFGRSEMRKLLDRRNAEIRRLVETYPLSTKDLAEVFGLSRTTVTYIVRGANKKLIYERDPAEVLAVKERNSNMLHLRLSELWTLQQIGDLYEISRERVRQIVGSNPEVARKKVELNTINYGRFFKVMKRYAVRKYVLESVDKTNKELADILGILVQRVANIRGGQRHKVDTTTNKNLWKGRKSERILQKKLEEAGYLVELMPFASHHDILINGKVRADVKSCWSASIVKQKYKKADGEYSVYKSEGYSFGWAKKRLANWDLLLLYIADTDDVLVIPAKEMPSGIRYPKNGDTKYRKYLNNWDMVEKVLNE